MNYTPIPKLMCPICRNHCMVYATDYYKCVTGLTSVTCDLCGYQNSIIGALFCICNNRPIQNLEFPEETPLLEQFPWARHLILPMTKRDWALVFTEEHLREDMVLEKQIEVLYPILNACVRWDSHWKNPLPLFSDRRIRRVGYTRKGFQSIDYLDRLANQKGTLTDMVLPVYREENHRVGLLQLYNPLSFRYIHRNACGIVKHRIGFESNDIRLCYRPNRNWKTLILVDDVLSYLKMCYWFQGLTTVHPKKFKPPVQVVLVQNEQSLQVLKSYNWKAETIIYGINENFMEKSIDTTDRLKYSRAWASYPWDIPVGHIAQSPKEFEKYLIPLER